MEYLILLFVFNVLVGLGKTALSKRVSNAEEVSDYFNSLVIWLVVSHSFDLIESLNKMVEILFGVASNMKNRQALILKLREKLKEKKYLLILDDVWDTTFWESFRLTLREIGGCKGSTLLVTSRNINVVARMETYSYDGTINRPSILALEELSEGDSWALFLARINDDVANSEKQLMAKRMIKNCGGVPLAIRALGDLLRRNQSIVRWREIEKSELWVKEDEYNILPSLRLSYNYLPNTALKKCFSYCAIFKEDEVIEKGRLIKMWMAHGFLQPYDQMECVGEEYFDILLNNSLFQEAERDEIGDVKTFKIHDLALSLARAVSGGQCLRLNEEYDESNEVRHLSVPSFKRQLTTTWCTKLQTIFLKDKVSSVEIQQLKKCTHLRVLKIGGFTDWNSMLELLAGTFKHLRYLEIDDYNVDETALVFPNFKLYHLQTLWIGSVTSFWNSSYPSILTGIRKLVNLRHLDYPTSLFGIPKGIGCLTALQTLPKIDLMHDPELKISELGLLGNLRGTLEIRNLKFTNCDADFLSIFSDDKLKLIERLIISWDRSFHTEIPFHNEVIEALQPKRNLKMLEIEGYFGTKFPPWLTERGFPLDNLVALTLRYCQNDNLKDLKVVNFKYLQSLVVDTCGYLRISFPEDGFHCCNLLQHLTVNGYAASFLPDLSPLTKLRTLLIAERRSSQKEELVGLSSLPCLKVLFTNQLLPADLDEHSPVCKSLRSLTLYAPDDDYNMETIQHMVALNSLALLCYKVEIVPEWMGNLTALRCLEFYEMLNLKQLPSQQAIQRLSHLETFKVVNCPLLMEDLQNKSGEWFKIAHIPHIFLD
ncbi:putative disease resistance protein RGA3 [Bienertia sinuspersici]